MLYGKDFSHLRLFLRMPMSIDREGRSAEAQEPAAAAAEVVAAPKGVNVAKHERVMPSIESLNALNAAERSAADKRERGETPMGNLEAIAREADARAQETLVAQTTGFVNRVANVAKGAWKALSGLVSFINKDIVLPAYDSLRDLISGRKENGELVGESVQKIEALQNQISNSSGPERDALERQLADEQDQLAYLRDPHNAARDMAAREKVTEAAEKAEARAFMKSEAERIAAENLAAAVARAKEAHTAKLESQAINREARTNLGRVVANLLAKVSGEDVSTMGLSEEQLLALGTVIDGAKRGIIGAVNLPGRAKTGLTKYIDGEVATAKAAYERTSDALYDMTLGKDREELWAFTKDAVSFTGAVLMNKAVQQQVLDVLGQKRLFAADEKGNIEVIKNRGTADVLANAIKDGLVNVTKEMGTAVAQAAREIRDSEAVATVKKGAKNTVAVAGAGAAGYAIGTAALATTPFAIASAPFVLGASATGAAAYGTYRAGKKGYEMASTAASRQLNKMIPGIVDTVAPMVEAYVDLDEMARKLPENSRLLISKVGGEAHKALMDGAEAINAKTRQGLSFYNDMKARLGRLSEVAQLAYNKLEQEALAEAARAKNSELCAEIDSAIDARVEVDAEAALQAESMKEAA